MLIRSKEKSPTHATAAIILSAGKSSRMQSPKALLKINTNHTISFAEHLVDLCKKAGCDPVILVTGYHATLLAHQLPKEIQQVYATDWQQGMRASLRAGLQCLAQQNFIFTHVDHPLIQAQTLQTLCQASQLSIPTYKGHPGHPVFIPKDLTQRLVQEDSTPLFKILQESNPHYIEIDDPGILVNINTPQDYQKYSMTISSSLDT